MDIKTKDSELYYLACVLSEAICEVERMVKNNIALRKLIFYDARFQFMLSVRDNMNNNLMKMSNDITYPAVLPGS